MPLVATGIPVDHVQRVWGDLWPLLEPAHEQWSHDRADVLAGLLARQWQLWAVYEEATPVAAIVTRLWRDRSTGDGDCRIWLVGGQKMPLWLGDFIWKLIPWALSERCSRLTASGRPGWWPFVKRYGGYRIADEHGLPAWALDISLPFAYLRR